jgi:NAD(P)H-hydrate epimerase
MTDGGSERGRRHLGQEEAREFDNCLFNDYQFSIDQLMEVAGLCVAQAVVRSYPASEVGVASPRVLVVCGPGNNGGDGLVAARHLLFMGYDPEIYYPKRTSKDIYKILVTQCEKLNIRFLTELPSAPDIDRDYHVIVDAVFGFSFKGAVRSPFDTVLATLVQCSTPIASVDVPSGWDVENGDPNGTGLKPDTLVSLTAPKTCSQLFTGRHHYLGLRMIPSELASKYNLDLPPYPGTDQIVRL